MITIDYIAQSIPTHVGLTQRHYATWIDLNWERLDGLKRANPGEGEAKDIAIELFISFQAFHVYFRHKGLDRIQLNEDYELWRNVLRPFFGEDQYYGEVEYIHDEDYADRIVRHIVSLDRQLKPLVAAAGIGEPPNDWDEIDDWTHRADEAMDKATRLS